MPYKTKETRKCMDCDTIIPFIKYKTRCVDCYKKNKIQEDTKQMLKNDFNLFINDSDTDEEKTESTESKVLYSGRLKDQCLPKSSWLLKD